MRLSGFGQRLAALVRMVRCGAGLALLSVTAAVSGAGAATVTGVTAQSPDDTYRIGDVITIQVVFTEAVTVSGQPTLLLETGTTDRAAAFTSVSANVVLFAYTVQQGDIAADLDYVSTSALQANGGEILDGALAPADLTLPGGSLAGSSDVAVDGVRPTVTSILPGAYQPGSPTAEFEVEFSEPVLGFTIDDMILELTGSMGPSIASILPGAPGRYVVNIEGLTGEGSIGLVLSNTTGITDFAGNPIPGGGFSFGTIDYDLIAPSQPVVTSPSENLLPNGNLTFAGTADPDARLRLSLDSGGSATIFANSAGNWSFTPSSTLPDGSNSLEIFSEDFDGNMSDITFFSFTVDSTPPDVPVFTSPAPSQIFPTPSVTLAGTAERGAQVEVQVDAGAGYTTVATVVASGTGAWTLATLATDGSTARARAIDAIGNASTFSAGVQIVVDSTGPVVTSVFGPAAGAYGAGGALDFTVNFNEPAVVAEVGSFARLALNIGGQTVYADYLSGSGTEELTFRHVIEAGAQDADGVSITALEANGGVIVDGVANVANLTLNGVALNLIIVDSVGPTVVLSAPAGTQTGPFPLTITFSEDIFAFTVDDLVVANATVSAFGGSSGNYQATLTPTGGDITVSLDTGAAEDELGNPSAAATPLVISTGSAVTELEANADLVREIITDAAERELRAGIAASQRMVKAAQGRLIAAQDGAPVDRKLTFDGVLQADGLTMSSAGGFGGETTLANGMRRIVFGDFRVNRDADGTVSARLDGRVAWERMLSDDLLAGYFIGADIGRSDISRELSGPLTSLGVTVGGYGVRRLSEQLYLNAFASATAGRNDLELSNGTLVLDSTYGTQSLQAGGSLTGVVPMNGFELRPELSLSYGRTWIGDVDLSGAAFGGTGTLTVDAGQVTLATIAFQPEFVIPLDGQPVSEAASLATIAPGITCEEVSGIEAWSDCGVALGLGLNHASGDGLSRFGVEIDMLRVGPRSDTSISLVLEHRF